MQKALDKSKKIMYNRQRHKKFDGLMVGVHGFSELRCSECRLCSLLCPFRLGAIPNPTVFSRKTAVGFQLIKIERL